MQQLARATTSSLELLKSLEDLDKGVISHTYWLKELHGALICEDQSPSENDISEDAHCRCKFGHWYYNESHEELKKLTLFQEIGVQHKAMHEMARKLLQKSIKGNNVSSADYNGFIETAIDFKLTVRKLQNKIIDELCIIDHLTGTLNRHSMSLKLSQEHERIMRNGGCCALAMIDVDHFKLVNDTHGHATGDLVLRGIAERLSTHLRSYDYLFRYGGEEFLICLPDSDCHIAEHMMERLRLNLEEQPLELENGLQIPITASFGISHVTAEKSIEDALIEADHALLYAKSTGRNRVHCWDSNS